MKWSRAGHRLLLLFEDRAVRLALVRRGSALDTARFELPADADYTRPEALGQALAALLGNRCWSARRAVAFLPVRWMLVRAQQLPPVQPAGAAGMLRLAAERELAGDLRDWTIDATSLGDAQSPGMVMLAAIPNARLDEIVRLCAAAGLQLEAVTCAALALADALAPAGGGDEQLMVHLAGDGAEMALLRGRRVVLAQHLPTGSDPTAADRPQAAALAQRMTRAAALLPPEQSWGERATVVAVGWQDSAALGRELAGELRLPAPPQVNGQGEPGVEAYLAKLTGSDLAVDFLHSKLAPPPQRWIGRRGRIAVAVGLLLALAGGWLAWDFLHHQAEMRDLTARLEELKPTIELAQANVDRVNHARLWHDRRPAYLAFLRELSLAFPESGPIWTTSLATREDLAGTLSGKAQDERTVLELLDRMKAAGVFEQVKLQYIRQTDRRGRDVSFAVSFAYIGARP